MEKYNFGKTLGALKVRKYLIFFTGVCGRRRGSILHELVLMCAEHKTARLQGREAMLKSVLRFTKTMGFEWL